MFSNESAFLFDIRGADLFEIRLLFNRKEITIRLSVSVIKLASPMKYVAAQIDALAETYPNIDLFEKLRTNFECFMFLRSI